jgi:hypothetical protein
MEPAHGRRSGVSGTWNFHFTKEIFHNIKGILHCYFSVDNSPMILRQLVRGETYFHRRDPENAEIDGIFSFSLFFSLRILRLCGENLKSVR